MIEMYGTKYYQISLSFIGVIYFIGLLAVFFYYIKSPRISSSDSSICTRILVIINILCLTFIIPLFIPLYLCIGSLFLMTETRKDNVIICQVLCLIYILPQNIIHWLIITVYNDIISHALNYILYLLLSIAILLALMYYILFIYIMVTICFSQSYVATDYLNKLSIKLIYSSYSADLVLVLFMITVFGIIEDDVDTLFKQTSIILAIISLPLMLPYSTIYHRKSKIYKSVYRRWIIPSKTSYEFYDKLYSIIHEDKHNSNDSISNQELLISDAYSYENQNVKSMFKMPMHEAEDAMICIKYQYKYFKLSNHERIKYVKQCEYKSIWSRYFETCECVTQMYHTLSALLHICMLIVRVYIMFGFPLYWFIYRYLDEINGYRFCNDTHIDCIQNIFVSIMFVIYWVLLMIFCGALISITRHEYIFGYIAGLDMDVEYSCKGFYHKILLRNWAVFQSMQHELAIIVCSYLPAFSQLGQQSYDQINMGSSHSV